MSYREDDICVIEFLHAPSGVTLNEAGDSGNVAGTRGGYSQVLRGAPSCWLPPGVETEEWKEGTTLKFPYAAARRAGYTA